MYILSMAPRMAGDYSCGGDRRRPRRPVVSAPHSALLARAGKVSGWCHGGRMGWDLHGWDLHGWDLHGGDLHGWDLHGWDSVLFDI